MTSKLKTVFMEQMTWSEIRDALDNGIDTVLIGFGSTEQHGPHLPISTDAITATKLCQLSAEKLGDVLVAPTIHIGSSKNHMVLPGTIDIDTGLLEKYLMDYCMCLIHHGFKNIFIVPTHGGNFQTVEKVEENMLGEKRAQVKACYKGKDFVDLMRKSSAELNIPGEIAGTHSGEQETSIMMYLCEDLVREDKLQKGFVGDYDKERYKVLESGMTALSANGIIGDATRASRDRGKIYVDNLVEFIIDNVKRYRK